MADVLTFNSSQTWTPTVSGTGVCYAWGGGGSGGSCVTALLTSGGGGGGGAFAKLYAQRFDADVSYDIERGAGGTAPQDNGASSWICRTDNPSVKLLLATGGNYGFDGNGFADADGGNGGDSAACIGDEVYSGGLGGKSNANGGGGGGGAGAGEFTDGAPGDDGTLLAGGAGGVGVDDGGSGGDGGGPGQDGLLGDIPGGGGGGAGGGTVKSGANGRNGRVVIIFTPDDEGKQWYGLWP